MKGATDLSAKFLILIIGPTAAGKTALSLQLANNFETEIVSVDSRQIFREMKIGTAKPSEQELSLVKHHFINSHSIKEEFNSGRFEEEALKVLDDIFERKKIAIAVGGSGLYVNALCNGMDEMPQIDPSIRANLNQTFEQEGIVKLQKSLEQLDPEYYNQVDKQNPQRLIRALEVCLSTGKPYSTFRTKKEVKRSFTIIKIGLEMDRDKLYKRIDLRMDEMIENGLFEEAKELYPLRHLNALQTVGYTEIFDFIEGKYDREEAIRLLKRNSRRYAKRQLTWFKRDHDIKWFRPDQEIEIKEYIQERMGLD